MAHPLRKGPPTLALHPSAPPEAVADAIHQARARAMLSDIVEAVCAVCDRHLCMLYHHTHAVAPPRILIRPTVVSLDPEHYCRWCAKPVSEEAEAEIRRSRRTRRVASVIGD